MALVKVKPTSPGRRSLVKLVNPDLHKGRPQAALLGKLKGMGLDSVLLVTAELDENLYLASRNLIGVLVLEVAETDPLSLIRFPKVLLTKSAVAKMEEMLA